MNDGNINDPKQNAPVDQAALSGSDSKAVIIEATLPKVARPADGISRDDISKGIGQLYAQYKAAFPDDNDLSKMEGVEFKLTFSTGTRGTTFELDPDILKSAFNNFGTIQAEKGNFPAERSITTAISSGGYKNLIQSVDLKEGASQEMPVNNLITGLITKKETDAPAQAQPSPQKEESPSGPSGKTGVSLAGALVGIAMAIGLAVAVAASVLTGGALVPVLAAAVIGVSAIATGAGAIAAGKHQSRTDGELKGFSDILSEDQKTSKDKEKNQEQSQGISSPSQDITQSKGNLDKALQEVNANVDLSSIVNGKPSTAKNDQPTEEKSKDSKEAGDKQVTWAQKISDERSVPMGKDGRSGGGPG